MTSLAKTHGWPCNTRAVTLGLSFSESGIQGIIAVFGQWRSQKSMADHLRFRTKMKTVLIFPTLRRFREAHEHDARAQHHRGADDN